MAPGVPLIGFLYNASNTHRIDPVLFMSGITISVTLVNEFIAVAGRKTARPTPFSAPSHDCAGDERAPVGILIGTY